MFFLSFFLLNGPHLHVGTKFHLSFNISFSLVTKLASVHYHHLLWCEFNTLSREADCSRLYLSVSEADGGTAAYQHQTGL